MAVAKIDGPRSDSALVAHSIWQSQWIHQVLPFLTSLTLHATVIVVEAEKTPQPVIEHLRNTLTAAGAKTAGIVMNKRRFYIPARVYKKL